MPVGEAPGVRSWPFTPSLDVGTAKGPTAGGGQQRAERRLAVSGPRTPLPNAACAVAQALTSRRWPPPTTVDPPPFRSGGPTALWSSHHQCLKRPRAQARGIGS